VAKPTITPRDITPQNSGSVGFLAEKLNTPKAVIVVLVLFAIVDGFLLYRYHGSISTISFASEQTPVEVDSAVVQAKNPRAIFLGDSFTEGAGGSRSGGYVTYAGEAAGLNARPSGVGATGIVADYGGVDGKKKFRERLSTDVFPSAPKVVVIAGGINDRLLVADGTATPSQYRTEYDALIADIKTGLPDAKIVVLGPFCPGTPSSYTGMEQIRDLNKEAAQAAGVPFIDVFYFTDADRSRYTSDDGFHLNQNGAEILALDIADLVKADLRARGAPL